MPATERIATVAFVEMVKNFVCALRPDRHCEEVMTHPGGSAYFSVDVAEVLVREQVLQPSELELELCEDADGVLHQDLWCASLPAGTPQTRRFPWESFLPNSAATDSFLSNDLSTCSRCESGSFPVVVPNSDQRTIAHAYWAVRSEVARNPRGHVFAALAQIRALRRAHLVLASLDPGFGPVHRLVERAAVRLTELDQNEKSLYAQMRSWVAHELICNNLDASSWPETVRAVLPDPVPQWMVRDLVQVWRTRSSGRNRSEVALKRSSSENVLHRIRSTRQLGVEQLRSLSVSDFDTVLTDLGVHLSAVHRDLVALPEDLTFLVAWTDPPDFPTSNVLSVVTSNRVDFVPELIGRWLENRNDLVGWVQIMRAVPADFPPGALEVAAGLFSPADRESPLSDLGTLVQAAVTIV